jgi:hypothetical protein
MYYLNTFSDRPTEWGAGTDSDLHGDGGGGDCLCHTFPGL